MSHKAVFNHSLWRVLWHIPDTVYWHVIFERHIPLLPANGLKSFRSPNKLQTLWCSSATLSGTRVTQSVPICSFQFTEKDRQRWRKEKGTSDSGVELKERDGVRLRQGGKRDEEEGTTLYHWRGQDSSSLGSRPHYFSDSPIPRDVLSWRDGIVLSSHGNARPIHTFNHI